MAKILPEGSRLPRNFPTFDFYDESTRTAISVKTLDTMTGSAIDNPSQIYSRVKGYVDNVADFERYGLSNIELTEEMINHRVINLGIPENTSSQQLQVLIKVQEYAKSRDVNLNIIKIKVKP